MSHLIIQPIDSVCTPEGEFARTWHGLETVKPGGILHDGSNVMECLRPIRCAGFKPDFSDPISDLPAEAASELGENPVKDFKVLLADLRDNGQGIYPVHVAGKGYTVHQNADLFRNAVSALDSLFGRDGYEIATVGTLGAYSQFFLSIALRGESDMDIDGDTYKSFFNVISSHNSLISTGFHLSAVRVVCMNTVQMSLADADATGRKSTVRHTLNSGDGITADAMAANLKKWVSERDAYKSALLAIKGMPMTLDGFRSFAAGVFTNNGSDSLSTVSFNRIASMESLFLRGKGNSGVSVYDAVNAFTEFFTSGDGVGKSSEANKRLASANFGRGNEWKLEAMRIVSDEALFAECMKRGETFYSDKLLADAKNAGK